MIEAPLRHQFRYFSLVIGNAQMGLQSLFSCSFHEVYHTFFYGSPLLTVIQTFFRGNWECLKYQGALKFIFTQNSRSFIIFLEEPPLKGNLSIFPGKWKCLNYQGALKFIFTHFFTHLFTHALFHARYFIKFFDNSPLPQ